MAGGQSTEDAAVARGLHGIGSAGRSNVRSAQARAVNHLVGGRSDHIGDLPAFFFIFFFYFYFYFFRYFYFYFFRTHIRGMRGSGAMAVSFLLI